MPPVTLTLRAIDDEIEPGIYTHYDFALLMLPAAPRDPEGRRRLRRRARTSGDQHCAIRAARADPAPSTGEVPPPGALNA